MQKFEWTSSLNQADPYRYAVPVLHNSCLVLALALRCWAAQSNAQVQTRLNCLPRSAALLQYQG